MNKTATSKMLTGFTSIYLLVFFTFLAGIFYPLITNSGFDSVAIGILILFVGFAGGVLLHKAATSDKRQKAFLGGGFLLIAIALYYIIQFAVRF